MSYTYHTNCHCSFSISHTTAHRPPTTNHIDPWWVYAISYTILALAIISLINSLFLARRYMHRIGERWFRRMGQWMVRRGRVEEPEWGMEMQNWEDLPERRDGPERQGWIGREVSRLRGLFGGL